MPLEPTQTLNEVMDQLFPPGQPYKPKQQLPQETTLYQNMRRVFTQPHMLEHWKELRGPLVDQIIMGLEFPVPHKKNRARCRPFRADLDMALSWDGTKEGSKWWMDMHHRYRDNLIPNPDEELLEDEEEEHEDDDI
jgi:hypothetical protein